MFLSFIRTKWWLILSAFIVLASLTLSIHNATLYHPHRGFDGSGHKFYIEYIHSERALPSPSLNWETHQPPLYYLLGAGLMNVGGAWKTAQYLNTFVLWAIVGMVGLGIWRIFHKKEPVLIGMLAAAALPMLNIFPPMLTNELLNTFFIMSALVAALFLLKESDLKQWSLYIMWLAISLSLGAWTKISIILAVPAIAFVFVSLLYKRKIDTKKISILLIAGVITLLSTIPVVIRMQEGRYINPNPSPTPEFAVERTADFYYRMDWLTKLDIHQAHYYSLLGGGWNSFWSDGHNAITPVVPFHKKAFILWLLGFILLPVCVYGFVHLWKKERLYSLCMFSIAVTMLGTYVYYNATSNHYSSVRLTYEMGIVLPYAFGLAGAATHKKLFWPLLLLLTLQFVVMMSFYWIEPWWHVTNPV